MGLGNIADIIRGLWRADIRGLQRLTLVRLVQSRLPCKRDSCSSGVRGMLIFARCASVCVQGGGGHFGPCLALPPQPPQPPDTRKIPSEKTQNELKGPEIGGQFQAHKPFFWRLTPQPPTPHGGGGGGGGGGRQKKRFACLRLASNVCR